MAVTTATQEAMFLKQLLHECHQGSGSTITIHEDDQSCIALSKNSMTTGRSKHMDARYHFCREKVESGDIEVQYCATENMLDDVLTKPLVSARHNKLCNAIMGLPPYPPDSCQIHTPRKCHPRPLARYRGRHPPHRHEPLGHAALIHHCKSQLSPHPPHRPS
jgi:hypothetical protein